MSAAQVIFFRDLLEKWKEEIASSQSGAAASTRSNRSQANKQERLLKEIECSLNRLADGTYGYCMECGEEIGTKRLNARPVARRCLRCQETHEFNEISEKSSPD